MKFCASEKEIKELELAIYNLRKAIYFELTFPIKMGIAYLINKKETMKFLRSLEERDRMNKTYDVKVREELLSSKKYLKVYFTNDKNWWQTIEFKNKKEWLNFKAKIDNIHKEILKVCKEEDIN